MEVCMTHPESCGPAGGAVSLWFRLNRFGVAGAIVTTVYNSSAGYHINCDYRGISNFKYIASQILKNYFNVNNATITGRIGVILLANIHSKLNTCYYILL